MNEDKLKDLIKKSVEEQKPDAWGKIERRLKNMEQKNNKKQVKWGRAASLTAALCAVAALAVVTVALKPTLLSGQPANTTAPAVTASQAASQPAATPTPAATVDPMQIREPVAFEGAAGQTAGKAPMMKPMIFVNLADFAKVAQNIAEFKFVKQLETIPSDDGRLVYTDYEMQVTKVLKGDLKPGDTITLQVLGGASDKVWIEDNFVERLTSDFDYVLFVAKYDDNGQAKYQLCSSYQGYVPVLNGKVSLNTKIKDNGLYTQGEALNDLESRIQDALK